MIGESLLKLIYVIDIHNIYKLITGINVGIV